MNLSVFYFSARFLSSNFESVSKLSLFTFESLVKINKDSSKVTKAIEKNHVDVLKILIHKKDNLQKDMQKIINDTKKYQRSFRISVGTLDIVIDLTNDYIKTHNYKEICTVLLTKETCKHVNDIHFYFFCSFNFYDCVKILIEFGYTFHHDDAKFLDVACYFAKDHYLVELLMNNGSKTNDRSLAASTRNYDAAKVLINHGIKHDIDGALETASSYDDIRTIKLLIDHGAKISTECVQNALGKKDKEMIKLYRRHNGPIIKAKCLNMVCSVIERLFVDYQ